MDLIQGATDFPLGGADSAGAGVLLLEPLDQSLMRDGIRGRVCVGVRPWRFSFAQTLRELPQRLFVLRVFSSGGSGSGPGVGHSEQARSQQKQKREQ